MGKISNGILVLESFLYCVFKKLIGCNICNAPISLISPHSHLITRGSKSKITIGYKSCISPNTELSASDCGQLKIGDRCFFNRNCLIACHESITIGNNVTVGPGTYIYDHDHDGKGGFVSQPILIGNNVWIGAGCIILKGVSIGDNVIVAAGCLVTSDIPSKSLIYQKRYTCVREIKLK